MDHPRICGEKSIGELVAIQLKGSPPHMRGKAVNDFVNILLLRITPAYAGKSPVRCLAHRFPEDHPRICGEKTKKIP